MSQEYLDQVAKLQAGAELRLSGWIGASKSFVLTQISLKTRRPLILVAENYNEATLLKRDLDFFLPKATTVSLVPPLDALPYYNLSPHPDIEISQLGLLWKLTQSQDSFIMIVPLSSLTRRLIPRKIFIDETYTLIKDQQINREEWIEKLVQLAYQRCPLVEDHGTFAIRGGLIDIYSPAHENPFRIEFFGDTIESIRFFDPTTQKSIQSTDQVIITPARQILLHKLSNGWTQRLKKLCDHHNVPKSKRDQIQESFKNLIYFHGIESYLPFVYSNLSSLFDYLPNQSLLVFLDKKNLLIHHQNFLKELSEHRKKSTSVETIFNPEELFLKNQEVEELSAYFPIINIADTGTPEDLCSHVQMQSTDFIKNQIRSTHQNEKALKPLALELDEKRRSETHIYLATSSLPQGERIYDLLSRYELPLRFLKTETEALQSIQAVVNFERPSPFIQIIPQPLSQGFYWPEANQLWITDEEIFGQKKARKPVQKSHIETFSSFSELTTGDYIVHQDHGVGIYKGLINLKIDKTQNDFLLLEYLGGDKLYVPVDQLDRISRYQAQEGSHPTLDKMGSSSWKRTREKVKKATRKLAHQLLELQAARLSQKGFAYSANQELYEEFEATFPFDETPDQLQAIKDVVNDMESEKPMDRLVCGDVGYGKTEVAIRAAFKAINDQKQVAILVPTTILAFQHFETFYKRFKEYPMTIELLSRFQTNTEQKKIIANLQKGQTDIVIATHRLLSSDVRFHDLGLLVIDEEHRFGVQQKEKIKKLKALVDVLTLSATPIPRTLNFALFGIRDLSLINTPPADRLSIRTYVTHFEEGTIREAILKEMRRDGQIYFVHNRVQTISGMKTRLQKIVPEAIIEIAHGQMPENELENVMLKFMERKIHVLLCSTIIESGLDIPTANTIIMNRADHLGLAQLYQLRGRVGRSNHRAYCYLLIPHDSLVTKSAQKRLAVIQRFTELGSGFKIASHDLEIRGAGQILGSEQSGHIAAIGYDLYVKLLEEAINILNGKTSEEEIETELKLSVSASIPESLVPDTQLRLILYKQLSSAKNEEQCLQVREEWIDRFGILPQETENLIFLIRIKVLALQLKIVSLVLQKEGLLYQIAAHSPLPTNYFLGRVSSNPTKYKILPDGKFFIRENLRTDEEVLKTTRDHLLEMRSSVV